MEVNYAGRWCMGVTMICTIPMTTYEIIRFHLVPIPSPLPSASFSSSTAACSSPLNCIYLNACNLKTKLIMLIGKVIVELQNPTASNTAHIIVITETWLKKTIFKSGILHSTSLSTANIVKRQLLVSMGSAQP